jgi:hypothetical protein
MKKRSKPMRWHDDECAKEYDLSKEQTMAKTIDELIVLIGVSRVESYYACELGLSFIAEMINRNTGNYPVTASIYGELLKRGWIKHRPPNKRRR